jgi:hypothetical protein
MGAGLVDPSLATALLQAPNSSLVGLPVSASCNTMTNVRFNKK